MFKIRFTVRTETPGKKDSVVFTMEERTGMVKTQILTNQPNCHGNHPLHPISGFLVVADPEEEGGEEEVLIVYPEEIVAFLEEDIPGEDEEKKEKE